MTMKFKLTALAVLAAALFATPMLASADAATAGLGSSLSDSGMGQHSARHKHHRHHRHRRHLH
jgi:hypothetical protein